MALARHTGMSTINVTVDHTEIRQWVEARQGKPARARGIGTDGRDHVLGIEYDDDPMGAEVVELISWDDWFASFDADHLAFIHEDDTMGGKLSRFSQIVVQPAMDDRETRH
jgi:hypothetical protein